MIDQIIKKMTREVENCPESSFFGTGIILDVGVKRYSPPLIPNCYVLCTSVILKTFVIRSFFFKKWLLTHVFGGSQGHKSSCKQVCIGLPTF